MSKVTYPEDFEFGGKIADLERRIKDLETSASLPLSSIGSGGLTVKNDGKITFLDGSGNTLFTIDKDGLMTFEPDGSTMSVLDDTRLRFNRSDGVRQLEITPGGGLKIYDTNGTTEKVVVSSTGLSIDGILQPALAVLTQSSSSNPSITTTETTENEITFTIPSWADEVSLLTIARLQNNSTPSGNNGFFNELVNDVGGLNETTNDFVRIENTGISINSSTVALTTTVSSPGSSIVCRQNIQLETGSSISGEARLEGIAIVRRTS